MLCYSWSGSIEPFPLRSHPCKLILSEDNGRRCYHAEPVLHILLYHRLGMGKYEQLGRDYPLMEVPTPSAELTERIKSRCERLGVKVKVGE